MSEDEEQNKGTSKEVDGEQSTRKDIDVSDGRLYHEITVSSRKRCNISSM